MTIKCKGWAYRKYKIATTYLKDLFEDVKAVYIETKNERLQPH